MSAPRGPAFSKRSEKFSNLLAAAADLAAKLRALALHARRFMPTPTAAALRFGPFELQVQERRSAGRRRAGCTRCAGVRPAARAGRAAGPPGGQTHVDRHGVAGPGGPRQQSRRADERAAQGGRWRRDRHHPGAGLSLRGAHRTGRTVRQRRTDCRARRRRRRPGKAGHCAAHSPAGRIAGVAGPQ